MTKPANKTARIDVVKFTMSVIAWCICVMTICAVVAFHKWLDAGPDWVIDIPIAFGILVSLAFGILCFLAAAGQLQLGLQADTPEYDSGTTLEKA